MKYVAQNCQCGHDRIMHAMNMSTFQSTGHCTMPVERDENGRPTKRCNCQRYIKQPPSHATAAPGRGKP